MQQVVNLPTQIKITEGKNNSARVIIEPCFPGYGVTLGNVLRRVLLSSLPGAAVTAIKIPSTAHEFSTIPGVKEDVIEIILNLKQLRFKLYNSSTKMTLNVKGERKVKAKDIKVSSDVEIANPNLHIASLTSPKAKLDMEIFAKSGRGYESSEEREKKEIGIIAIDALYSPVRKVAFRIENVRVGKKTNYDKLILDVETDGTIDAKKALDLASHILVDHFKLFYEKEEKPKEEKKKSAKTKEKKAKSKEKEVSLENLKLSSRTLKSLNETHIKSVGKLTKIAPEKLLGIKGLGEKGVKEISRKLKKLGLSLKE